MHNYLDFEKPISDLEGKIHELRKLAEEDESIDTTDEVGRLEVRAREAMADIYSKLSPWQKTQVARHPQRPHFVDYAAQLFEEFTPLAGDRKFAEDEAIQAGLGRFNGEAVAMPLKEFELLEILVRNSGRVLTRMQLIDRVWGTDYVGDTKTLDVHVKRLRAKVEPDPGHPKHIVTVRGLGYKFED